jgi:lysyl-tRNA synthetase class I
MIYTEAFDNLPEDVREAIFQRMWQILSGQEKGERYARLSFAGRKAVVDILRETKHGLPVYFKSLTQ